jgi:hypothetical protein
VSRKVARSVDGATSPHFLSFKRSRCFLQFELFVHIVSFRVYPVPLHFLPSAFGNSVSLSTTRREDDCVGDERLLSPLLLRMMTDAMCGSDDSATQHLASYGEREQLLFSRSTNQIPTKQITVWVHLFRASN